MEPIIYVIVETRVMMRKVASALAYSLLVCSAASAQELASKMFETTTHDFGTVARDSKSEYEFVLKNPYVDGVHIASVTTSCGCTTPIVKKDTLKTYEQSAVIAHFNTDRFSGSRSATLTVTFDRPFFAQAQLHVSGVIRTDVVVNPSGIDFGVVEQGALEEKAIAVRYGGWGNWKINDIRSANPYLTSRLVEVGRGNGIVDYHIFVRLDPKTPPGYLNDHLILVTSDGSSSSEVPVPMQGFVRAGIVVSPTSLFMGIIGPGKEVTKPFIVTGIRPFRIVAVKCEDKRFQFDTSGETAPKAIHVISVTFLAGEKPGKIIESIRIETDLAKKASVLSAYADVAK
jgi:hypothetical protein